MNTASTITQIPQIHGYGLSSSYRKYLCDILLGDKDSLVQSFGEDKVNNWLDQLESKEVQKLHIGIGDMIMLKAKLHEHQRTLMNIHIINHIDNILPGGTSPLPICIQLLKKYGTHKLKLFVNFLDQHKDIVKNSQIYIFKHIRERALSYGSIDETGTLGFYDRNYKTVNINPHFTSLEGLEKIERKGGTIEHIILHEIIHCFIGHIAKEKYESERKNLLELYESIIINLPDKKYGSSSEGYFKKNIHEFISEAFSNTELQKEMANHESPLGIDKTDKDYINIVLPMIQSIGAKDKGLLGKTLLEIVKLISKGSNKIE